MNTHGHKDTNVSYKMRNVDESKVHSTEIFSIPFVAPLSCS